MKNHARNRIAAMLLAAFVALSALPFALPAFADGEVIEVRSEDELEAALNKSAPVAEIRIVQDMTIEGMHAIMYDAAHIDNYHNTKLIIEEGVNLRIAGGGALANLWPSYEGDWETPPLPEGKLINRGNLEVDGGASIDAAFDENYGEVVVHDGGEINCPSLNNGTVVIEDGAYCGTTQGERSYNNGSIVVYDGGRLESRFGTPIVNNEGGRLTLDGDFNCGCLGFDGGVLLFENHGVVEGRGSVNLYDASAGMEGVEPTDLDAMIAEMMAQLGQETRFEDWGDIGIYKLVDVYTYEDLAAALPGDRVIAGEPVEGDMDVKITIFANIVIPEGEDVHGMAHVTILDGVKVEIEEGATLECGIENMGEIVVHRGGQLHTTMGGEIRNGGTINVEQGAVMRSQMGSPIFNLDYGVLNLDGIFYCGALNMDNFDVVWFENFGQMTGSGEVAVYEVAPEWMPVSNMDEVVARVEGKIGEGEDKPTARAHTDHFFTEWSVLFEPTCVDPGTEYRFCGACGVEESRETPALGHDYVDVVTPPDGDNPGYVTHTCTRCGAQYISGLEVTDVKYGDVNGDGKINKKDSLDMKKYLADNEYPIDLDAADVMPDGKVNKKDALRLKQYLAGWDVALGPDEPVAVGKGDVITFGSYEQDNDTANGKEKIEWIVLDVKDGKALLLSQYALDAQPYNTVWDDVSWKSCTIRGWLNNGFYNAAFDGTEKARICDTTFAYDAAPGAGEYSRYTTTDKVFLLSVEDAINTGYGFTDQKDDEDGFLYAPDNARKCFATAHAKARGILLDDSPEGGNCEWWLRANSDGSSYAASVLEDGSVNTYGEYVDCAYFGVRPAIWIEL